MGPRGRSARNAATPAASAPSAARKEGYVGASVPAMPRWGAPRRKRRSPTPDVRIHSSSALACGSPGWTATGPEVVRTGAAVAVAARRRRGRRGARKIAAFPKAIVRHPRSPVGAALLRQEKATYELKALTRPRDVARRLAAEGRHRRRHPALQPRRGVETARPPGRRSGPASARRRRAGRGTPGQTARRARSLFDTTTGDRVRAAACTAHRRATRAG